MLGRAGCLLRWHAKPDLHLPQVKRPNAKAFAALTCRLDRASLTKRQRQVLELRAAGMTLAEIGRRLGISGERVRQIEARLASRARRLNS